MTSFFTFQRNAESHFTENNISLESENDILLASLYFSNVAYFSQSFIHNSLFKLGAIKLSIYDKGNAHGYLAEFENFVVVSFRGNGIDKIREFKDDMLYWKSEYSGIRCHNGFVSLLTLVENDILADLNQIKDKQILFTGHSLGGALLSLFSLKYSPALLVTFGSPRVTNKSAKSRYSDISYYRVTIDNDVIPHLPFAVLGYSHFGKSISLPAENSFYDSHKLITYVDKVSKYINH